MHANWEKFIVLNKVFNWTPPDGKIEIVSFEFCIFDAIFSILYQRIRANNLQMRERPAKRDQQSNIYINNGFRWIEIIEVYFSSIKSKIKKLFVHFFDDWMLMWKLDCGWLSILRITNLRNKIRFSRCSALVTLLEILCSNIKLR